MKSLCILFGCVVALGAFAQAPDLKNMDVVLRSVPDGPVAKVNGVNIRKDEFVSLYQTELAPIAMSFKSKDADVPDEVRIETAVRCMGLLIQRELLFQEAVRRNLSVTPDEINKGWNAQLNRLKEAFSKARNERLSDDDILRLAGATREEAMAELKKALLIEKMRDAISKEKNVTVTDEEVRKAYNSKKDLFKQPGGFHLERIFINTRAKENLPALDDKKKAEAKEKMENALKQIQAGESFESVAKAVSEAPDKDHGGDTGFVPTAGLPPSYVRTLETMKPGDVSPVFEDELGFHIVKLIEKKTGGEIPFEQAKDRIRQAILAQKSDHAVNEYCQEYMAKSPECVRVYLQLEKSLATNPEFKKMKEENAAGSTEAAPETEKAAKPKTHRKKSSTTAKGAASTHTKSKKAKPKPAEPPAEAPPAAS